MVYKTYAIKVFMGGSIALLLSPSVVVSDEAITTKPEIIVESSGSYNSNLMEFNRVTYIGQCPGTVLEPNILKARFTSNSTLPNVGRRVIIRNVTEKMNNNPYPYTNREYSNGRYSESFNVKINIEHKEQTLSILEGENNFAYEIEENKQILEKGNFTAMVKVNSLSGVFRRDKVCRMDKECVTRYYDENRHSKKPRSYQQCYPVEKCSCP